MEQDIQYILGGWIRDKAHLQTGAIIFDKLYTIMSRSFADRWNEPTTIMAICDVDF